MTKARVVRDAQWLVALWWAALAATVILVRPVTAVDETRYLAVAWEMHRSQDLLLLHLNGSLYGHKPPLLFWLIELGWRVAGVNTWWPRLLTASAGFGSLMLLVPLVRRLVPDREDAVAATLLITGSALVWTAWAGAVLFDLVLAFFVLLSLLYVVRAAQGGGARAWAGAGLAMGLGILTKGPVALLHVLPLALLGPWWIRPSAFGARAGRWYAGVALAIVVAAAVALAWAVPAAIAAGPAFREEIFWRQSAGRIASEGYHARPFWFHLALLPILLAPWLFFPPIWRALNAALRAPASVAVRFAIAWAVPVVIGFSLFKGKQPQYLLPEIPAFALLMAFGLAGMGEVRRRDTAIVAGLLAAAASALPFLATRSRIAHLIDSGEMITIWITSAMLLLLAVGLVLARVRWPERALALVGSAAVAALVVLWTGVGAVLLPGYDLRPVASAIAEAQARGQAVAHFGDYHGEYQFIGRLTRPLEIVRGPAGALQWAEQHPDGCIVIGTDGPLDIRTVRPVAWQAFRSGYVYLWRGADLRALGDAWYGRTH